MANNATETLGTEFTIGGLAEATTELIAFAQLVKSVQRSFNSITGGSKRTRSIQAQPGQPTTVPMQPGPITIIVRVNGYGGGSTNAGSVASRAAQRTAAVARNKPYGMFQRQLDLRNAYTSSVPGSRHRQDIVAANIENERRIARYQKAMSPRSRSSKLMNAIMSTRVNIGHVSPLIGRSLAALSEAGIATEAIPGIGLLIGATVLAAKALYDLSEKSAAVGNQFTRMEYATGSSAGTTAQLQAVGSALGLTPETMSGIAANLQNSITSDPMARAAGMRLGVFNLPGMFGNQDTGAQLITALTTLRGIKNPTDQIALARQTGLTALLPMMAMSNSQFAHIGKDSAIRTSLMTPQFKQEAADFQAAVGRIGDALNNVLIALGPAVLPVINEFINDLADGLQGLAQWISANQGIITTFLDLITGHPLAAANSFMNGTDGNKSGSQSFMDFLGGGVLGMAANSNQLGSSTQNTALADNTAATQANTRALRMMIPGKYGTTTRDINTALPTGLNGQSIDRSALALSTF